MLNKYIERTEIFSELSREELHNYFDYDSKDFIHNIDTFYYSVKLCEDFRSDSKEKNVLAIRKYIAGIRKAQQVSHAAEQCKIPGLEDCIVKVQHFSKYYECCISKEGVFDLFIASVVPPSQEGTESDTAEIIVQLRSEFLWRYPTIECFEKSMVYVRALVQHFRLTITAVKENRTDYCWHTNYISNPEKYFDVRSLHEMAVTRIHQGYQHWSDRAGGYDIDYVALGKRSNKIFIRIYLKSKEVVEMGYKGWFLKLWKLQGMISGYDFYCYEKAYEQKRWAYLNVARLEWYLEYGRNEDRKKEVRKLLEDKTPDQLAVKKLADQLTPKVTMIMNIEYQVMRRATKSFELLPVADRSDKGAAARVYEYLDNTPYVTEYLTHDVFRLCKKDNDRNSRRSYNDFWERLRRSPLFDGSESRGEGKLLRQYNKTLDLRAVKRRFVNSAVSVGLYTKGLNSDSVLRDCLDAVSILNDNDIFRAERKKGWRLSVSSGADFMDVVEDGSSGCHEWQADDVGAWIDTLLTGGGGDGYAFEG